LMLALAGIMLAARTAPGGHRILRPAGIGLIVGGILVVATTLA
jgi:hypothetical protein